MLACVKRVKISVYTRTHNPIEYHHSASEDNDWIRLFLFERYSHFDLIGLDWILYWQWFRSCSCLFLFDCLFVGMFHVRHFVRSFDCSVSFELFYFYSAENIINWDYDGGIEKAAETVILCVYNAWLCMMMVTAVTLKTFVGMDDDSMHAKLCHRTFKHPHRVWFTNCGFAYTHSQCTVHSTQKSSYHQLLVTWCSVVEKCMCVCVRACFPYLAFSSSHLTALVNKTCNFILPVSFCVCLFGMAFYVHILS